MVNCTATLELQLLDCHALMTQTGHAYCFLLLCILCVRKGDRGLPWAYYLHTVPLLPRYKLLCAGHPSTVLMKLGFCVVYSFLNLSKSLCGTFMIKHKKVKLET